MRLLPVRLVLASFVIGTGLADSGTAQETEDERARVLAVVEASLEDLSNEDLIAFTDRMIDEAVTMRVAERDGRVEYAIRTRDEWRADELGVDIVERGFDAVVHVSGPLAVVWLPYDIYVDGEWSHCGVDVAALVKVEHTWKIASLAWTVEQPPACRRHPDGPPTGR